MNQQSKQLVLFDFDGTIADSLPVMVEVFRELAKNHKHLHALLDIASTDAPLLDHPTVNILRRQGLMPAIKSLKLTKVQLMVIYLRAQRRFSGRVNQLKPCHGIDEALSQLSQEYTLGIVTSNSRSTVQAFLDRHDLNYFDVIKSQRNLFAKSGTISQLIRSQGYQVSDVVYVGDEVRDIEAAQKSGIASIGVAWGLNHRDLLAWHDATMVIDHPDQLAAAVAKVLEN